MPRSKYPVDNRAAEGSYHSETDEDNRRHQLWEENRGALASSAMTSVYEFILKTFMVELEGAVGRVRTAVTERHACHLAPAVHDWHTAQLFITLQPLILLFAQISLFISAVKGGMYSITYKPGLSAATLTRMRETVWPIPKISTQSLNVKMLSSVYHCMSTVRK